MILLKKRLGRLRDRQIINFFHLYLWLVFSILFYLYISQKNKKPASAEKPVCPKMSRDDIK